jgi:succinate dehydrogenase / fumarate reductase membrane anchor subunit
MGRGGGERGAHRGSLGRQLICSRIEPMDRQRMRSPLARAMGLGSAKEGVEHWWMERVSAVALVPLTLWFVASIIAHTGSDYATFIAWLRTPLASILMILLVIALFYHTALGLQVVIEDYVHSGTKFAALVAVRLSCFALAAAGILAVLRIAFDG